MKSSVFFNVCKFLDKSGIDMTLKNALVSLIENRPENPILFLSDLYFPL